MDTLIGDVTAWRSEPKADSGWHIIHVLDANGSEHTVVGCSLPRPGAHVELQGTFEESKYGPQFKCRVVAKARPPLGAEGVARWLRERVPGIGGKRAAAMLAHFGGDAVKLWAAIEAGGAELSALELPPDVARAAHEAMLEEGEAGEYQALLFGWGMTQRQIAKVKKHWPLDEATRLLHANPYLLADHVQGFGFKRADAVATRIGISPRAPVRMHAAILHYLGLAAGEGHVFADHPVLMWIARSTLISAPLLLEAVKELRAAGRVVVEDGARIYHPTLHEAECNVAKDLVQRFRIYPNRDAIGDAFELSGEVVDGAGATEQAADPWQQLAVQRLADLTLPIVFITGGPGTGKTTVLKRALEAIEAAGATVYLGAPTGKAAKRMQEATGRRANTLHSLLGYRPETPIDCEVCRAEESSFDFSRLTPSEGETRVVVVDEASMVDLQLWAALTELGPDTRLRFIGDAHQLPPVGAGQPFTDVLGVAPAASVVRLRTVYRTKGEWGKAAAPMVLAGKAPPLEAAPGFRFIEVADADRIRGTVRSVYAGEYDDEHFRVSVATAAGNMPTLIPQRTGSAGVNEVTRALHDMFNPPDGPDAPSVRLEDGNELRVGSWVMVIKNDARKRVCNGDTGFITSIAANGSVSLNIEGDEGGERVYSKGEARERLRLAYASTVHKSQGSEYPWIVVVCHSVHRRMLTRRLLYTAITRARDGVVLIGDREGVEWAVANAREVTRCTWLPKRLGGEHYAANPVSE